MTKKAKPKDRRVPNLTIRNDKGVTGGGFSIGKALGSVVSAPFKSL